MFYIRQNENSIALNFSLSINTNNENEFSPLPDKITDTSLLYHETDIDKAWIDLHFGISKRKNVFTFGIDMIAGYYANYGNRYDYLVKYQINPLDGVTSYYDLYDRPMELNEMGWQNVTQIIFSDRDYIRVGLSPIFGFSHKSDLLYFGANWEPQLNYYFLINYRNNDNNHFISIQDDRFFEFGFDMNIFVGFIIPNL